MGDHHLDTMTSRWMLHLWGWNASHWAWNETALQRISALWLPATGPGSRHVLMQMLTYIEYTQFIYIPSNSWAIPTPLFIRCLHCQLQRGFWVADSEMVINQYPGGFPQFPSHPLPTSSSLLLPIAPLSVQGHRPVVVVAAAAAAAATTSTALWCHPFIELHAPVRDSVGSLVIAFLLFILLYLQPQNEQLWTKNSFLSYRARSRKQLTVLKIPRMCVSGIQPWQAVSDGDGDLRHIRGSFWCSISVTISESTTTFLSSCPYHFPFWMPHLNLLASLWRASADRSVYIKKNHRNVGFPSPPNTHKKTTILYQWHLLQLKSCLWIFRLLSYKTASAEMQRLRGRELHASPMFGLLFLPQQLPVPKNKPLPKLITAIKWTIHWKLPGDCLFDMWVNAAYTVAE